MLWKFDHILSLSGIAEWTGSACALMLSAGGRLGGNAVSSRCWAGSPDLVRMTQTLTYSGEIVALLSGINAGPRA
jgi:hypothetical protein